MIATANELGINMAVSIFSFLMRQVIPLRPGSFAELLGLKVQSSLSHAFPSKTAVTAGLPIPIRLTLRPRPVRKALKVGVAITASPTQLGRKTATFFM
jgi:hypothetical protein